ncbi:MAG: hypothetical protein H7X97_02980 [Opitutaceae bacterium]|nr:hypothetical protein [Verrucomicrobiales bacterium]
MAVGSLLEIGITTRQARWPMVGQIMFAWITTVLAALTVVIVGWWRKSGFLRRAAPGRNPFSTWTGAAKSFQECRLKGE